MFNETFDVSDLEHLYEMEVSHAGEEVALHPGTHVNITGPHHNGIHAVRNVNGDEVTLVDPDGREVVTTLNILRDHEVQKTGYYL
jgi:hypothetical protein